MKTIMTLIMAVMAWSAVFCQGRPGIEKPDSVSLVIGAVLQDFPSNLRHITGELALAQGETESYASMVHLPGSESCMITAYHSDVDTTVSWQAKMPSIEDYGRADRLYRELYARLKQTNLLLPDGSLVPLQGRYEPAREDAAFTTSTLRLATGDERYKYVKVELELLYLTTEWTVNVNVVSKKADDEVGAVTEQGSGIGQ